MKKRSICLLTGLLAAMLVGCGAKETGTVSTPGTQESVVASSEESVEAESSAAVSEESVESSESTETKENMIGAGPDHVVLAHEDSVTYWDDEAEEAVYAQYATASELVILSPGYEKLKAAITPYNEEAREGMIQAIEDARSFMDEEEDWSYAYFPWNSSTTMHVTRSDAQLFSYMINYYDYMGGAHGFYYNRAHNYEPETGRELKLSDLVTDLPKLQEMVVEKIKEEWDTDELFDGWEDTVAAEFQEPDTLNYLAGANTICIWFDVYDIAPYVCGEIEVVFAMEDCDGLFNEAYFHAENAEVAPGKTVTGTGLFQDVMQSLAGRIGTMKYNEVKALLDKSGYTYEEEVPGVESDGTFLLKDPENGAVLHIYFWPVDIEKDEDYENPDKYFLDCMRYELDENTNGWIGRGEYETITEYEVIEHDGVEDSYEELHFETVEEMMRYLFY